MGRHDCQKNFTNIPIMKKILFIFLLSHIYIRVTYLHFSSSKCRLLSDSSLTTLTGGGVSPTPLSLFIQVVRPTIPDVDSRIPISANTGMTYRAVMHSLRQRLFHYMTATRTFLACTIWIYSYHFQPSFFGFE